MENVEPKLLSMHMAERIEYMSGDFPQWGV